MFNRYSSPPIVWPFPKAEPVVEIITDPLQLDRIKFMFAEYTLDEAIDFNMEPNKETIDFERNGSIYSLHYTNNKLQRVIISSI